MYNVIYELILVWFVDDGSLGKSAASGVSST